MVKTLPFSFVNDLFCRTVDFKWQVISPETLYFLDECCCPGFLVGKGVLGM